MLPVREYSLAEWRAFGDRPPMAEPFIVRAAAAEWPAMSRLTFDGLRAIAADLPVTVQRSSDQRVRCAMTLGAYLDYCETTTDTDPWYLKSWAYRETHRFIHDWMQPPAGFRSWTDLITAPHPDWTWLYIGPAGSGSGAHIDVGMSAAYNVVLSGEKVWRIYPEAHAASVALRHDGDVELSPADSDDVWTCTQYPGDLIYVPAGLAHSAANTVGGVAFTENFVNGLNYDAVVAFLTAEQDHKAVKVWHQLRIANAFADRGAQR